MQSPSRNLKGADTDDLESLDTRILISPKTPSRNTGPLASESLASLIDGRRRDSFCPSEPHTPRREWTDNLAKDTPPSRKMNEMPESFDPNSADDLDSKHAEEARRVLIGPMPLREFLDEFLPSIPRNKPMPDPRHAFDNVPEKPQREAEIYDPFIEAINKGNRCPSIVLFNTSNQPEHHGRGYRKPDGLGYTKEDGRQLKAETGGNVPANLGLAEIVVEFKLVEAFRLQHDHSEKSRTLLVYEGCEQSNQGKSAKKILGQNVAYAAEACERQHRVFYFSVLVVKTRARFFRWDRAGVIVTESFDYRDTPEILCEFFWRLHLANAVERGYDPTVTVATPDEEIFFREHISEEVAFQSKIDPDNSQELDEALQVHYQEGKVTKVRVYSDSQQQQPEEFLVSVPLKSPKSAAGRCTRGYWSVQWTGTLRGAVVFLKDTWRVDVVGMIQEGLVYEEIDGKVSNISEVVIHGDVPCSVVSGIAARTRAGRKAAQAGNVQRTRTDEFLGAEWVCDCLRKSFVAEEEDVGSRIVKHTHYRLVLRRVGYPLTYFLSGWELFKSGWDILEALTSAFERCGRLHRDVSFDNIILSRCRISNIREGILIDWEFSVLDNRPEERRPYFRSGDWAFMSAAALRRKDAPFRHTKEDDLESLFYVMLYGSVRWLPNERRTSLGKWMRDFFDSATDAYGVDTGGTVKQTYLADAGVPFFAAFMFTNKYIHWWFKNAYKLLGTVCSSKTSTQPLLWSADRLRPLFRDLCARLLNPDVPRVENYVEDVFMPLDRKPRATHTPNLSLTSQSRGRKRLLSEPDGTPARMHGAIAKRISLRARSTGGANTEDSQTSKSGPAIALEGGTALDHPNLPDSALSKSRRAKSLPRSQKKGR